MSKNRLKLVKKQYTKKASYVVMRLYDELLLCYYYVNENNNLKWTTQETYKRYIYICIYYIYICIYLYIYIDPNVDIETSIQNISLQVS